VSGDEVRLVVHVRDENDNTPYFEGAHEGRPIVAAISASASYGDEVVRLHVSELVANIYSFVIHLLLSSIFY
jgi:hypothetical protein